MTVNNFMSKDIVKVPASATVVEATKIMDKKNIGCVLAAEDDKIVGIMTERDVLRKVVAGMRSCSQTIVREVMSSPIITIDSNEEIDKANDLMTKKNIRRLVVTENNKIVGILTIRDVARGLKYSIAKKILGDDYMRPPYEGGR